MVEVELAKKIEEHQKKFEAKINESMEILNF